MTDHQIEQKLKSAFTSDIPDNFDQILEKCEAQDKIISISKKGKWNVKYMRRIISAAAAVVIIFTAGIVGFHLSNNDLNTSGNEFSDDGDFFGDDITANTQNDFSNDTNSDAVVSSGKDTTNNDDSNTTEIPNDYPETNATAGTSWKQMLAAMPKKLRSTSLTVYNWAYANEYTGAPSVIAKFKQQTGIDVKWQTVSYETYFKKLATVIASGKDVPDVVRTRGPIPSDMLSYEPLSAAKFDFSDAAWDKDIMNLYTIDGKTYATHITNSHIGSIDLLFYNKALIDKYDLEDPYRLWKRGEWSWEKYLELCREYKSITGNPASSGEGWYSSYTTALGVNGAIAFDGKKFYNNMGDTQFLKAHKELGDLYNVEKLFALGQNDLFNQGKCLFSIGNSSQMRRKSSYFTNLKDENTLYAVPMPMHKGEKYVQSFGEAEAYAIAKGASNPEAVPYFLRCFLDAADYDLNSYFGNRQNLEVYNWCINQNNKSFVFEYPQEIAAQDSNGIMGQSSEQMQDYIDSKMEAVDKIVDNYNKDLKNIF